MSMSVAAVTCRSLLPVSIHKSLSAYTKDQKAVGAVRHDSQIGANCFLAHRWENEKLACSDASLSDGRTVRQVEKRHVTVCVEKTGFITGWVCGRSALRVLQFEPVRLQLR